MRKKILFPFYNEKKHWYLMNKKIFRFMFSVYVVIFILLLVGCLSSYFRNDNYYELSRIRNEYVWRTAKLIFNEYVREPLKETEPVINDYERRVEKIEEKANNWWLRPADVSELYTDEFKFLEKEQTSYNAYNNIYNCSFEESNDYNKIIYNKYTPLELIEILLWIRSEERNKNSLRLYDYSEFSETAYNFITKWEGNLKNIFDRRNINKKFEYQEIIPFEFRAFENNNSLKDKILKVYKSELEEINVIIEEQQNILDMKINDSKLSFFLSNCLKPIIFVILIYYIVQIIVLLWFVNFILNWWKKSNERKVMKEK